MTDERGDEMRRGQTPFFERGMLQALMQMCVGCKCCVCVCEMRNISIISSINGGRLGKRLVRMRPIKLTRG